MKSRIIVFGCGGHARSIVNVLYETSEEREIILVDEKAEADEIILGCRVRGSYELGQNDHYIVAIGNNKKRREIYNQLKASCKGQSISVISAFSYIGVEAGIGDGTFVAPNAYIGPQAKIGNNTIINTGSIVEHEVQVGNDTHIAPNATVCGRARIGSNVFCGAASTVIDGISICDDVILGAGAVVKEDIVMPGTYVGVPARRVS